jgi:hypothetical protein
MMATATPIPGTDAYKFRQQYGHNPSVAELAEYRALGDNPLGLLPESLSGDANDLYAEITRAQWNDFQENDIPYLKAYADEITSGQTITDAVTDASKANTAGYASARESLGRQQSGLGLALSSRESANQKADLQRSEGLSAVDAVNSARTAAKDRQSALLSGSYTGLSDINSGG